MKVNEGFSSAELRGRGGSHGAAAFFFIGYEAMPVNNGGRAEGGGCWRWGSSLSLLVFFPLPPPRPRPVQGKVYPER